MHLAFKKITVLAICFFYGFAFVVMGAQPPASTKKIAQETKQPQQVAATETVEMEQNQDHTPAISEADLELLARAVYSEARGEPFQGQIAIAAVILNRVEHENFPDAIAEVIYQPAAFTAVQDGQFWLSPDNTAYAAVKEALKGEDPSGGAIYYYNPATATSAWIYSRPVITAIGKHVFAV